jgi:DHA1 family bicyclomycin/chloramphenicol resistance-like MFS transporter
MSASSPAPAAADPARPFPLAKFAIILGLFTAAGPIGIDLYLPAFPSIQQTYAAETGQVQLTLVAFFVALAFGQLLYGPLADRLGRKGPLAFGFAVFLVASIGAALSHSIVALIGWRFLQGIGACAGMVISRSIARDLGTGERVARLFSLTVLVLGVSPILAPSLGAALLSLFPWTSTFWFMAGFATVALAIIAFVLEETLAAANRATGIGAAFVVYGRLLVDGQFLRPVLTGAFAQAGFFTYLAGSPEVLISFHGVSPTVYSLLFGVNAVALIGASQFSAPMLRRFAPDHIVGSIMACYFVLAMLLLTITLLHLDGLVITVVLLFFITGCLGGSFPITAMRAIEHHPKAAGAASALMGAIQFGAGALAAIVLSRLADGTALPLAAIIAGCATLAAAVHFVGRGAASRV